MLSLAKNLYGKYFEEYISICFDVADIFSLTENGWTEAKKVEKVSEFLDYLNLITFAP